MTTIAPAKTGESSSPNAAGAQTARAALWMIGTVLSFTVMAIAGRTASLQFDTFEIMLYRSLTGMVIVLAVALWAGTLPQARTARPGLHLVRNMVHFAGQNLWFYAIATIPLAQVFALEFTAPVWVVLLSPVLIGETLTRRKLTAATLGLLGVLVVARPDPATLELGTVAAASAAIFFALTNIATRQLTRGDTITCILIWLTVTQAVFGLICAGIDGDIALPDAASLPWLMLIGCAGLSAHFCLTRALSLAPASIVMPIDFIRLPVIAVVGMILFDEPLQVLVFAGAALIFVGNWLNLTAKPPRKSA